MTANTVQDIELAKTIFFQALREILPSLRLLNDVALEKRIGKEKTLELVVDTYGLVLAGGCEALKKNEQSALLVQMLRCLTNHIKLILQLPVTLNVVVSNMSLLEFAVDEAFPGYISSGLLKYAILPVRSNVA